MIEWITQALRDKPELVLFLVVGLGHALGKVRVGRFALGTVIGALLAGLVVGQLGGLHPDRQLSSAFFLLFLFANGYSVGPQFVRALKGDGLKPLVLSVVVAVVALATTYACALLLDLDPGMAAGLFSGALTASPAMGTAMDAIRGLEVSDAARTAFASSVVTVGALTYVLGAIGMVWFVSVAAPWLLRIDLRKEAAELEALLGIDPQTPGVFSASMRFGVRAYRLANPGLVGKRVADVEKNAEGFRYFIERIGRGHGVLEAQPGTELRSEDTLVIYGRLDALVAVGTRFGPEVHDPALTNFALERLSVVVTNPALVGPTPEALTSAPQFDFRSVGVLKLLRGGTEIPFGPNTVLDRGDVVELIGPQRAVERIARDMGYAIRPSDATNLCMLGIGILLGALAGLPFVVVGNLTLTLGVSVGALVAGLFLGWLRGVRPIFGGIPQPALRFMIDFGLAAFIASAGVQAGPEFVHAAKALGLPLVLAGLAVTIVPQLAVLLVGHFVLRMHPVLLLGGLAGAQTFSAALAALQEKAGSRVPVLGYTVPYAASNVLLTACGAVMVALVA